MARLDQLPPDQRAVLQLLLKQGKSYGEIADLLKIERSAVKARAHDAVAVLVLLLTGGSDNNKKDTGPVGSTTTTPTNTSTTPQVEAQINLFPPGGGRKPLGVANVVTQSGQRGIALVGQDLPPTRSKFA